MEQKQSEGMVWKPGLYDGKLGVVSELGKGAVDWLSPKPGERILDLGCGTGDLAHALAGLGAEVTGLDASAEMITAARSKYPSIRFTVGDGQRFTIEGEPYDAVFSNAALHWMPDAYGVIDSVWNALKPGGRFVAEFGGKGNCREIVHAIQTVLHRRYGTVPIGESGPWYFPSVGEYAILLEQAGFRVEAALHFERPTPMQDGDQGLTHWLDSFGTVMLEHVPQEDREAVYAEIGSLAGKELLREGIWMIDYRRLRIKAVKPV